MKKKIYVICSPEGRHIKTYDKQKEAYAFLAGINWNIPEWHYDKLYKISVKTMDIVQEPCCC